MLQNRLKRVAIVFLIIFISLVARMFYIQIISSSMLSQKASAQRVSNIEIENVRGDFLDRNGIRFTSRIAKITAVLKPLLLKKEADATLIEICSLTGLDAQKTIEKIRTTKNPILIDVDQETRALIMSKNIEGISFVNSLDRYGTDTKAKHILGYINQVDNVGSFGLEKQYESILNFGKDTTIGVVTDANNNLLDGLGYRVIKPDTKQNKKLDIQLTLDYHIQSIIENALDKRGLTGAVVVEDVSNGNIVGICSKPDFNPNDVQNYLNNNKQPLYNRALAQYNIGSIFKLVDLAAVYEINPSFNEIYNCTGYIQVGNSLIRCSSYEKGGHGEIDISSALANSCNSYFINFSMNLGIEPILSMAQSLGLGKTTGLTLQKIDEAKGVLPNSKDIVNPGDLANISIGQGSVLATPVQIADMVATIANGGNKHNVNIVNCVTDNEGNKIRDLANRSETRVMSKATAQSIRDLMVGVIRSGTGKKANLDGYGGAGGKTGSAETGQLIEGEKVTQAWFAGFFPATKPKYSVAIFIENGKSGSEAAAPLFQEIGEEIIKKGL